MQSTLTDLLARRRDRAIAIILRVKEQECDQYLSSDSSAKLRKVVLDQLNAFYDLCADVMVSLEPDDAVLNEEYFRRLDQRIDAIHSAVTARS